MRCSVLPPRGFGVLIEILKDTQWFIITHVINKTLQNFETVFCSWKMRQIPLEQFLQFTSSFREPWKKGLSIYADYVVARTDEDVSKHLAAPAAHFSKLKRPYWYFCFFGWALLAPECGRCHKSQNSRICVRIKATFFRQIDCQNKNVPEK